MTFPNRRRPSRPLAGPPPAQQQAEKKIRFIYEHLPAALGINLLLAVGLPMGILDASHSGLGLLWSGANLLLGACGYTCARVFHRRAADEQHRPFWRRALAWGAFAQGSLWGLAAAALLPQNALNPLILITTMTGLTCGAILLLAPLWSTYLCFLLPAVVPISLKLLGAEAAGHRFLGVTGLAYTLAMAVAANRIVRWVDDTFSDTQAKESLTVDLEEANAALKTYHGQLETTVWARTMELGESNRRLQKEIAAKEQERLKATQAETQYRTLFETMGDGFARLDPDGIILFANPAADRICGVPPGTLAGRSLSMVLAPEEAERLQREALPPAQRVPSQKQCEILRPDGERRWLQVQVSPVWDAEHQFVGTSVLFQDLTEQRLSEEALGKAQQMKSLELLAGGVAHAFNNLMSSIMGNLGLAQLETPTGSPVLGYLLNLETAANRAITLTNLMLAYGGQGSFHLDHLNLSHSMTGLSELLKVSIAPQASLKLALAEDLPDILADQTQVHRILVSLVANASEALEGREGKLSLATRLIDLDARAAAQASRFLPVAPGPHVVLELRDTGCGMTPKVLDNLFTPFFTTKGDGRGLGLPAVLGMLRGHGAGLEVETRPSQGSTFRLFFPVAPPASIPPAAKRAGACRPFRQQVLLVDDDPILLETVKTMLERMSLSVLTARDGLEAMASFKNHHAGIGLVLLDLAMPRMDGRQAFHAMRSLKPKVPMILSSGSDARQSLLQFQGSHEPIFLQKPYTLKVLRQTIQSALAEQDLALL